MQTDHRASNHDQAHRPVRSNSSTSTSNASPPACHQPQHCPSTPLQSSGISAAGPYVHATVSSACRTNAPNRGLCHPSTAAVTRCAPDSSHAVPIDSARMHACTTSRFSLCWTQPRLGSQHLCPHVYPAHHHASRFGLIVAQQKQRRLLPRPWADKPAPRTCAKKGMFVAG